MCFDRTIEDMTWSASRVVIVSGILAGFGVGIGIIIGHFGIAPQAMVPSAQTAPVEDVEVISKLMNEISAERMRENLW